MVEEPEKTTVILKVDQAKLAFFNGRKNVDEDEATFHPTKT